MRDKVIIWLQAGANAQEGVRLLQEAGAHPLTLRLCASNPEANKRLIVRLLCDRFNLKGEYSISFSAPVVIKKNNQSFREEFPFLDSPSCPVELEALASRKFTRYYAYIDLHTQLRACGSLEECAQICKELIDNYLDNRAIWAELNYYQQHNKLLGKHPIFREFARRKELLKMSVKELIYRQQKIMNNIWRVKSEIKKGDKPHLDIERNNRLASYEAELAEVNRLLE